MTAHELWPKFFLYDKSVKKNLEIVFDELDNEKKKEARDNLLKDLVVLRSYAHKLQDINPCKETDDNLISSFRDLIDFYDELEVKMKDMKFESDGST